MNKISRHWMAAAIGAVIAFGFSSCAYDPYYSSAGGSYSSGYGYGEGYGYGGSNFSTSLFISTGDPRWGYDPHCYSYYDYRSHRYYDPYLYGYYPVGYRPVVVSGAPHPYGWRPGRGYCPPPRTVRDVTVSNYRNRESAYRNSNYSWSKQVRVQPSYQARERSQSPSRSTFGSPASSGRTSPYGSNSSSSRSNYQPRNSSYSGDATPSTRYSSGSRQPSGNSSSTTRGRGTQFQGGNPNYRQQNSNRAPSGYNAPVTGTPSRQTYTRERDSGSRTQYRQPTQPSTQSRQPGNSQPAQPSYQRGGNGNSGAPPSDYDRKRAIKGLGQG